MKGIPLGKPFKRKVKERAFYKIKEKNVTTYILIEAIDVIEQDHHDGTRTVYTKSGTQGLTKKDWKNKKVVWL